jgi:5-hydroxyisourate hydrolase
MPARGERVAGLTTHILDTAHGQPAAGVTVRAYNVDDERQCVARAVTNADGRTDSPLIAAGDLSTGCYELEFDIGDYFEGIAGSGPQFLGTVVIRVNLEAGEHYHVPLLASPFGYSTYRGS